MSFEENLKKLEEIVRELESGNVELDKALPRFNEAMDLVKKCSATLKEAEDTISKIVKEDGTVEEFEVVEN